MLSLVALSLLAPVQGAPDLGPVNVAPYVQLGTERTAGQSSVRLLYHTAPATADTRIEYRQGNRPWLRAPEEVRPVDRPGVDRHDVHHAILTGLKMGQPVEYRLMNGGGEVLRRSFKAPPGPRDKYRFVVFGDCGIGQEQQAKINALAYATRPDFVVITGDIVYQRGRVSEYAKNFWPYYLNPSAPLIGTSLTLGIPGNHDLLYSDLKAYPDGLAWYHNWSQPLNGPILDANDPSAPKIKGEPEQIEALKRAAGPNFPQMPMYTVEMGNAFWLCLDSNPYVDWQDPKIREWIRSSLARAKDKTWRFVVYHHPGFHGSKVHQNYKNMRAVHELFEDGKVDVVFNGHVHNYQRNHPIVSGPKRTASQEEREKNDWPIVKKMNGMEVIRENGVLYIVDGAGGGPLYDKDLNMAGADFPPFTAKFLADYSFGVVDVSGDQFRMRQIDKDGREVDRFTLRARKARR